MSVYSDGKFHPHVAFARALQEVQVQAHIKQT